MALRVDSSSSKVILGVAAFSALAVGTALFYRFRGNAAAAPAAPSLDQGRFAFLAHVPLAGRVYNYFNPAKKPEPVNIQIGSVPPIKSMEELRQAFSVEMKKLAIVDSQSAAPKYPEIASLVIYGEDLQITQDPGFLALRPSKLILVGAHIVDDRSSGDSLDSAMRGQHWGIENSSCSAGIEVASVDEALRAPQPFIPSTGKPVPTVYRVKA